MKIGAEYKDSNTVQVFWIAIGSLFAFGFGTVSSMILSRYLPKADYGTYKQVLYVYSTLLMVFTLGLPKAYSYFLPRVPLDQTKDVIKKITNLFFLLGGVFSVLLFFFAPQIANILRNPDLELALTIFSPVPLLMLPTMGLEGILSTFRITKFMAVYTIATRVLLLLCVALPVIVFGGGYIEAIIGFVIASFISFLLALYFKYLPVRKTGNDKTVLKYQEVFKFSLPLLYASLWGVLIRSADQFFISRYFGNEVFAEFSNGSLELPFVAMIAKATGSVLSPVFSRMSHERLNPQKEIFPLWKSAFEKSAKLIYPLVLFAWFFADILMVTLYGIKYENSAIYFRILAVINFFNIIIYGPLLINIGKVRIYANIHMTVAFLVIILEYISVKTIASPYAITVVSLLCQLAKTFALLAISASFFKLKIYQLFPLKLIFKIALPSIVILWIEYYLLVKVLNWNNWLILIVGFLIYLIFYGLYSYWVNLGYESLLKPLLFKIKKNKKR